MYRFSIRELMLVTLVVAMGLGWWLEHQNQADVDYWREFAEWQRDCVARIAQGRGHKVTFYDGWRVDFDSITIGNAYDNELHAVPHEWERNE